MVSWKAIIREGAYTIVNQMAYDCQMVDIIMDDERNNNDAI